VRDDNPTPTPPGAPPKELVIAGAPVMIGAGDIAVCGTSGDEATGRIVSVGNTSRRCEFEVRKIGTARTDISESAAEFLDEPVVTLRAVGTTVVPKEHQRFDH